MGTRATRLLARVAVASVAILTAVVPAAAAAPSGLASTALVSTQPAGPAVPASADQESGAALVLVGTTGLQWADVSESATPNLWVYAEHGTVGSNVVRSHRTATCPADGWLALSAGTRAADSLHDECRTLVGPEPQSAAGAAVPAWDDYARAAATDSYQAVVGTLGQAIQAGGLRAAALGPGAAVALADESGRVVGSYDDGLGELPRAVAEADVVVIDAGSVDGTGADRRAQVAAVDATVGAVRDALDAAGAPATNATVLIVSVADAGDEPRLQLGIAAGATGDEVRPSASAPDRFQPMLMWSASTRQPGYVQTHDFTVTVAARLGVLDEIPPGRLVGAAIRESAPSGSADKRVEILRDDALKSVTVRAVIPSFYTVFLVVNLALFAAVGVGLSRWRRRRTGLPTLEERRLLRTVRAASLAVGSLPLASYLANLVPWWRSDLPGLAVTATILGWVAVLTALCLAPPWRDWLLGPVGLLAGLTAAFLALDVVTGARFQLTSLMGTQPLVAGRFYGFNNNAFALFATTTLVLAAALANPLVLRGRRLLAAGLAAAIGVLAVLLDGLPSIGADFGGPPALVPGFAVLALLTAGVRLTWRRVLAVLGAAVAVVSAFAVADWLRPAGERTHLGNLVQTTLDGGLGQVVLRNLQQNLSNLFGSWLTLLALGGLAVLAVLLVRPGRDTEQGGRLSRLTARSPLRRLAHEVPMLRPALVALAVTHLIGFALNDSGIIIPAVGMSIGLPLLIGTVLSWAITRLPVAPARTAAPARTHPA